MDKYKKQNPLSVYAVVSQLSFVVVTPLLLFSVLGTWIVNKYELPDFLRVVFVLTGVVVMVFSAVGYIYKLIRMYDKTEKDKYLKYKHDVKDFDYYSTEYNKIKKKLL